MLTVEKADAKVNVLSIQTAYLTTGRSQYLQLMTIAYFTQINSHEIAGTERGTVQSKHTFVNQEHSQ